MAWATNARSSVRGTGASAILYKNQDSKSLEIMFCTECLLMAKTHCYLWAEKALKKVPIITGSHLVPSV